MEGPLFSPCRKEIAIQEDNMAGQRTSSRSLKSLAGAGIFALGLLLLFVNLDGVIAKISYTVGAPTEAPQILPVLGLLSLHAVQAYSFDHAGFFPTLLRILVSFWPLLPIFIGAVLLRSAVLEGFASQRIGADLETHGGPDRRTA
jgi:hypothetical protein